MPLVGLHDFVLKKMPQELWEEGVYELPLVSIPKEYERLFNVMEHM